MFQNNCDDFNEKISSFHFQNFIYTETTLEI